MHVTDHFPDLFLFLFAWLALSFTAKRFLKALPRNLSNDSDPTRKSRCHMLGGVPARWHQNWARTLEKSRQNHSEAFELLT
jgi:hypothetical protein